MPPTGVSNQLIGTWKLVGFQIEFENQERQNAYDEACGSLIITQDGCMSVIMADSARQSDDPPGSLFDRMLAYSGRYRIQGDDSFTTDVEVAWHTSWLGTEQTRYFKIEGDMLWVISAPVQHPKYPGRTVRGITTWRRE
jgi:Lipocalin-like domain